MKLPFRMRLRAWWDGYDPALLSARMAQRAVDEEERIDALPPPAALQPEAPSPVEEERAPGWCASRLAAAQLVWGEGSAGPRGEARLRALTPELGLSKASSIVHLGAEMGGTALMLQRGIGCRILPADTLPAFIAASHDRVTAFSQDDGPLATGVDLILVDHLAERGEPLARILRAQAKGLAKNGRLVIRALVKQGGGTRSEALSRWMEGEPVRPRLRSADELQRIVQEAGLTLNASRNGSDAYVTEIEQSWRGAVDTVRALHGTGGTAAVSEMLLAEGERWTARTALIADGTLCYREIIASRRS